VNVVTLAEVAEELGGTGAVDARAASATIAEIVRFPSGSSAIASCAHRAL